MLKLLAKEQLNTLRYGGEGRGKAVPSNQCPLPNPEGAAHCRQPARVHKSRQLLFLIICLQQRSFLLLSGTQEKIFSWTSHFMITFSCCFNCYYYFLLLGDLAPGKQQQTYGLQIDIKTVQCKHSSCHMRHVQCPSTRSSSSKPANSHLNHKCCFTLTGQDAPSLPGLQFQESYLQSEQNFTSFLAFCIRHSADETEQ